MLIVKNEDGEKKKKSPHLAVCHRDNGPANGRRVSLVMKSVDELTPEGVAALHALQETQIPDSVDIEKSTYQSLYRTLSTAVDEYAKTKDRWGWAYVRDFDDNNVVFSNGDGVYAVGYTESNGSVILSDEVISVNEMLSWEDSSGRVILTQSDSIPNGVSSLVEKSFSSEKLDDGKLEEIFKSKYMEEKEMDEIKAQNVALQASVEKAASDLQEAKTLIESLQAQLDEHNKAAAVVKSEARKEILKSIVSDGELESIHASLDSLTDEAFNTVTKSMKLVRESTEKASGMFNQSAKTDVSKSEDKGTDLDVLKQLLSNKE